MAYLDRLRQLGVSERLIECERDAWILVAAELPEQMATLMALKGQQLDDPTVKRLYRDLDAAIDWDPDDPRLPAVADRLVAVIDAAAPADHDGWGDIGLSDDLVDLLDSVFVDSVPWARRLLELLEERGVDRLDPV